MPVAKHNLEIQRQSTSEKQMLESGDGNFVLGKIITSLLPACVLSSHMSQVENHGWKNT